MKRVLLFLATNLAIMVTIGIIMSVFGIGHYITPYGLNYESLMIFCLLWGMGGAFISLLLSKKIAKWTMKIKIIDPKAATGSHQSLVNSVYNYSTKAGLSTYPEVGIYDSPEVNAFATGPSRSNSLVAVSTGLLAKMSPKELNGVLAHEIAHIANGDMVTMTLVQGVVNAFVMFLSRVAAFFVSQAMRSDEDEGPSPWVHFGLVIAFDILFGILASLIVAAYSRRREFAADAGSAKIGGKEGMIAALQALKGTEEAIDNRSIAIASLKISGKGGINALRRTHPTLNERIARLQAL
jgi:heat shock protein HtpX